MKKLPKFLISTNPQLSDKQYIIHTQEPLFIAEVLEMQGDIEPLPELLKNYQVGSKTKRINGRYYIIGVLKLIGALTDENKQEKADRYAKIMSRCGDWYYQLIKDGKI